MSCQASSRKWTTSYEKVELAIFPRVSQKSNNYQKNKHVKYIVNTASQFLNIVKMSDSSWHRYSPSWRLVGCPYSWQVFTYWSRLKSSVTNSWKIGWHLFLNHKLSYLTWFCIIPRSFSCKGEWRAPHRSQDIETSHIAQGHLVP